MSETNNHNFGATNNEMEKSSEAKNECNGQCDFLYKVITGKHRDLTEEEVKAREEEFRRFMEEEIDDMTKELHERYKNGSITPYTSEDLQKLDDEFYQDVRNGIVTKEEILEEGGPEWLERVRQGLLAGKGLDTKKRVKDESG